MELSDYIEEGLKRKNSVSALAQHLGIAPTSIADAKAHRRGLPNAAAVKLAYLIGADPIAVIAASELATETKEEKRAVWFPFVNEQKFAKTLGIAAFVAVVTNFMTPTPAEAAPLRGDTPTQFVLC